MDGQSFGIQLGELAAGLLVGIAGTAVAHIRLMRKRLGVQAGEETIASLLRKSLELSTAHSKSLGSLTTEVGLLRDDVEEIKNRLEGEAENVRQIRREVEAVRASQRDSERRVHDLEVFRLRAEVASRSLAERIAAAEGRLSALVCANPVDGHRACDTGR